MAAVDRVEVLRRLCLVLILNREGGSVGVDTDRLVVLISESDDRGHDTLGLHLHLCVTLTITLELLPLVVLSLPSVEIRVDVHLTTRDELDVLPSFPELVSVEPGVTEAVHLTVVSQAPAVKAILKAEVDMLLWVTETIESTEPRVRMKSKELLWTLELAAVCHDISSVS